MKVNAIFVPSNKTKMQSLKRIYKGHYELTQGVLRLSIVKTNTNEWESCIEIFSHKAKDLEGNNVDIYEVVGENEFSATKKNAYYNLEQRIINL